VAILSIETVNVQIENLFTQIIHAYMNRVTERGSKREDAGQGGGERQIDYTREGGWESERERRESAGEQGETEGKR